MRTVFNVKIVDPIVEDKGVFSNKSIAYDVITSIANNHQIMISEKSDRYMQFHNKVMNYINFTKYFKSVKNKTKLVLKIVSDVTSDNPITKTIECTMYNVNQN